MVGDLVGIHTGDYLITEAGFGADMGAERFFNIKSRVSGLTPDAGVVVVTVRALKAHSGNYRVVAGKPLPDAMLQENPEDVRRGADNLRKQIENIAMHGVTPVVAINAFPGDFESEYRVIFDVANEMGVPCAVSHHFSQGGKGRRRPRPRSGGRYRTPQLLRPLYPTTLALREKIEIIARRVYGADGIDVSPVAGKQLETFENSGFGDFMVCIAKTHLSISSDPNLKGAPTGWSLPVREVRASVGAGFIYAICGDMRTMPGLGSHPAAEAIDIDENGDIVGLY